MALTTSRQIEYRDHIEFVEHITGKKILSWRHEMDRYGATYFFTDQTMVYVNGGHGFPIENIEYHPIPKSICTSCGQDSHFSLWNWKGQCEQTARNFWKKVRKLYWHRYLAPKKE